MLWLEQVRIRQQRRLVERRNSMREELFRLELDEWNDPRNLHENRVLYDGNQGELLDMDHVARRLRIGHIRKVLGLTPMVYDRYWCYTADGSRNMRNLPVEEPHEDLPGEVVAGDADVDRDGSAGVGHTPDDEAPAAAEHGEPPGRRAWGAPRAAPDATRPVTPPDGPAPMRP